MATESLTIAPPKFERAVFTIRGVAPLVQNKFSAKAKQQMKDAQEAGSKAKNKRAKDPKDFMQCYHDAMHVSDDGWIGVPASAFRNAMISACRVAGFAMTKAKLSFFVEADGFDNDDATPLVKISKGEPQYHEMAVRNESGVADIRARPMWKPGWEIQLRVRWDSDQFTIHDVANLLMRAGMQVGIGEGRPDSKKQGGGLGWGIFELAGQEEA